MFQPKEAEEVQLIKPQELATWLKQADAPLLIDVRNAESHRGYNLGGKNIVVSEFASELNQLDPDQITVIYCQKGVKSFNAATLLVQADFSSVYSLHGGIEAWSRAFESSL